MFLGKTIHIHFIGIGGAGMSGIAEVLINHGYEVTGSDVKQSRITGYLESLGAQIEYGHNADNIRQAQVVVVSSAVRPDNVEVQEARRQMIPVIPRAEMLAELMRMKYGIAIAGTHGKTTTTSLVAAALGKGHLDPTVVTGGRLKSTGSHAKLGQSEFLVAEADESDGSFIKLSPTICVVTTLDEEHLDFYGDFENMKQTFLRFMNSIPFFGTAVVCLDDSNIQSLLPHMEKRYVTYGLTSQADYTADAIRFESMKTHFTVHHQGKTLGSIESPLPGRHNILNTLAAVAVGTELNLRFSDIADALEEFSGVARRFELVHNHPDLAIVDDYGHHPVEIKATLAAAKEVWPGRRSVVVFQPHRYSRTQHLLEEFCKAFNNADHLVIHKIYAAGEDPIEGIEAQSIVNGAREFGHRSVEYIENKQDIIDHLLATVQPGDVVITLGAGDIGDVARDLANQLPQSFLN